MKKLICVAIILLSVCFYFIYVQSLNTKNRQNVEKELEYIKKSTSEQTGKGFLNVINNDYESAIEHFSKSIELEPNNAIAYHQRGLAYYNIGYYQKALKDFNKTIELNPQHLDAHGNRSLVKLELKDYQGALDDINFILKITPNDSKAIKQKDLILNTMNE